MLETVVHNYQIYILKLLAYAIDTRYTILTNDNRYMWKLTLNL